VSLFSLHGFVNNLDEKFGRIALNKDYGHYLRAILCLFRPDFPQNPCSTDLFRIIHHATIIEIEGESYRKKQHLKK
jgi:uncharacterized protein YjhX (UPF0386 family)